MQGWHCGNVLIYLTANILTNKISLPQYLAKLENIVTGANVSQLSCSRSETFIVDTNLHGLKEMLLDHCQRAVKGIFSSGTRILLPKQNLSQFSHIRRNSVFITMFLKLEDTKILRACLNWGTCGGRKCLAV